MTRSSPARKQTPCDESTAPLEPEEKKRAMTRSSSTRKQTPCDESSTPDESDESVLNIRWARFRRATLTPDQRLLLLEQIDQRENELGSFDKNQWHCFMDRVAREYVYLHDQLHKNDRMHLHRETVLASAVAKVISQIQPHSARPVKSNVPQLVKYIQPMIEMTLNLAGPNAEEKVATQKWIAEKIKRMDYNYRDCHKYPEIMDDYVAKQIAKCVALGSKSGVPLLKEGEEPVGTNECYILSSKRVGRRRATASAVH